MISPTMRSQRGFTLLELAIATMILALVVLVVFSYIVELQRTEEIERARTEAQREARFVLDEIAADLARATGDSLDIAIPGSGLPLVGRVGQFESQQLYFETVVYEETTQRAFPGPQYLYRWRADGDRWLIERTIIERDSNGNGSVDAFEDVNGDASIGQSVTVLATEAFNEDFLGNGDGQWIAADDDQNDDGRPQRGLWFEVRQEDLNNDGLDQAEDRNRNGRNDATVTITVDVSRHFRDTDRVLALSTLSTTVHVQNAAPTN